MRARLTVIVLLLVVLPTAVLSLLAGRAFRAWELVLQDQVESAAARAIQSVWRQLRAETDDEAALVNGAMAGSLARTGRYEDVAAVARNLAESRALVKNVYLFMHPWGLLYPQGEHGTDRLRPGWDFPPKSEIVPAGGETLVVLSKAVKDEVESGSQDEANVRFTAKGIPYCFVRLDRKRDLYAGFEVDMVEFRRRLSSALTRSSGGAFTLLGDTSELVSVPAPTGTPDRDDVIVTDTFSPVVHGARDSSDGGAVHVDLSHPDLVPRVSPLSPLAEARLFAPFNSVKISAVARDPEELRRMGELHARLYVWGVLLLAAGIIVGAGFMLREAVTEIRLARAKSDFAVGVSHDLRTPVASMKMLAESLYLEHVPDKDKQREFLGTIVRECERLSQLIERVLFLVRFGQDALTYRPAEVDPGELTAAAVDAFRARQTGREIMVDVEDGLPPVKADRSAMTQVILNLLDNAAKYGGADIRVAVECVGEGRSRMVRIAVSDSGPGIDETELKRIFKPFYRGPGAVDSNTSGVGLGLAMCRRIVSEHAGRIEVNSTQGKGTTFSVFLPAVGKEA